MSGLFVVIFVLSLLFAIGLHEAGHFATAKWFRIKVDRFFIGFGPRLWSTKRGETEYGVSALPIGGYVRIAGMNPLEEIAPEDRPRTFKAKPAWQRAIVLAAGSLTHLIVAFAIIAALLATVGERDFDTPTLTIGSVGASDPAQTAPSERAGLKAGDRVVSVDGVVVSDWRQVVDTVHERPSRTIDIVVVRDGETLTKTATLTTRTRDGETIGFLGVSPEFARIHRSVLAAVGTAGKVVGVQMWESLVAFKRIFSPATLGRLFQQVAGTEERRPEDPATIVGIGKTSADLGRSRSFADLFILIAGFNIFVGVANLLPLPPLDGGHLAVLGYEKIRRRDVDMRRLLPVTAMVLTIFATLFVLLLYLDIVKPLPSIPG